MPDADLRGVLDLPVLIVAGDGAVAAVVDDLDDAEIVVNQDVPGECGDFESRTVVSTAACPASPLSAMAPCTPR